MRRKAAIAAVAVLIALAGPEVLAEGPGGLGVARAEAQKSGGGDVSRAGENAADLITELVGPVLIVLIGVVAIGAFMQRNTGLAITAAIVGLIAGLFIFAPGSAENAYRDIYRAIF
jgi:membrane associated rhomboid family serine protease